MARNEQLIRQHKIIQILERRRYGASLEDLRDSVVQELGIGTLHVRSIRRDIEALQAAGMAIITEETQTGKVWKMSRVEKGLHKIAITASELIALSMGRDLLLPLVGTQFWQGIEGFWNKVREQLPNRRMGPLSTLSQNLASLRSSSQDLRKATRHSQNHQSLDPRTSQTGNRIRVDRQATVDPSPRTVRSGDLSKQYLRRSHRIGQKRRCRKRTNDFGTGN